MTMKARDNRQPQSSEFEVGSFKRLARGVPVSVSLSKIPFGMVKTKEQVNGITARRVSQATMISERSGTKVREQRRAAAGTNTSDVRESLIRHGGALRAAPALRAACATVYPPRHARDRSRVPALH